jgi:hypothetical protein
LENYDRAVRGYFTAWASALNPIVKVISNTRPDPKCRIKMEKALSSHHFELRDHSNSPGFSRTKLLEGRIAAAGLARDGGDE